MASSATLDEFISEVCTQIVRGVLKAQSVGDVSRYIGVSSRGSYTDKSHSFVTDVEFDVAVTAETEMKADGKIGIAVANIKGDGSWKNSASNRVRFQVPVAIPLPNQVRLENQASRDRTNRILGTNL